MLPCLTRSVRRRAATSKRPYRTCEILVRNLSGNATQSGVSHQLHAGQPASGDSRPKRCGSCLRYVVSCFGRKASGHTHIMRNYYSVLALFAVWGMCAIPSASFAQTTTAPTPEINVRLSAPQSTMTAGTPIHVEVRVLNSGSTPTLVANRVSPAGGGTAFMEFKLIDTQGRVSPATRMIADCFGPIKVSDENASAKLLGSWAVLYPRTSLLFDIALDQSLLAFLGKPGKYKLSATYVSSGISYGRGGLGLSADLLNSLPFPCWSGRLSTNEITLTVKPVNNAK